MTSARTPSRDLSRRGFLGATFAAGVLLVAERSPVTASAAAGDVTLSAAGISVVASVGGRIAIRDGAGVVRSQGSRFQVKDSRTGVHVSTGGQPTLVTTADGAPAIRMAYTFDAAAGPTTVVGTVTVATGHAHLEWRVDGAPTLLPDGFLFSRAILSASEADDYIAVTEWVRDAGGGIPYERMVGVAHTSAWGALHGMFLLERSRQAWSNSTWIHSPGVALPGGGHLSRADFFFSSTRPSATASIGLGRELGVEVWTDRDFILWAQAGETMSVTALVANGSDADKTVDLGWWVRDYDGAQLANDTRPVTIAARSTLERTFTVAAPAQGILVAEVFARSGDDEAFARTTLAVLPSEPAAGPSAQSMFGIANYPWLQRPSADALLDLWQRVGVSRVRIAYDGGPGLPPAAYDERGMPHNIELQPSLDATPEAAAAWAAANLGTAIAAGAEYFEVGNELNRPFNTGVAAQSYIDKALRPVVDRAAAVRATVKIMNNGLAGMDEPWVRNFHAGGGWDLIDAFAFHPGRGNFTPDYVPDDESDPSAHGGYWNFYGGLLRLKALMAEYGEKEIWLTEAYACTRPNAWWNDTYRHAAENVFLTLALAKAEGVRGVNWYQFHDSVLGNAQVADPGNVEYHFGLMNRDLSAKPSLLAYANAARLLDDAVFGGWLEFGNPQTKGLYFESPGGDLAVLWNRADGYLLNAGHPDEGDYFPAPEVWVDPWPTKTTLSVTTSGDTAVAVDAIGRRTDLTVTGRTTRLVLDGAPRVYRGLTIIPGRAAGRTTPARRPRLGGAHRV
ncbi:hypothetical protein [Jiangella alkaliphila]|uniref:Glycosyl hydrolase catalytic core n=1 Tax=Jiangella alkaliphila TaxID=419479 RepID=A0A1H2J679_9ACTN|nr:hypothetical protein [Jiangella alkaliphila]SDU51676.1 hypothetical protein SAMN04488563_2325 [Jiangella alkaliphila]